MTFEINAGPHFGDHEIRTIFEKNDTGNTAVFHFVPPRKEPGLVFIADLLVDLLNGAKAKNLQVFQEPFNFYWKNISPNNVEFFTYFRNEKVSFHITVAANVPNEQANKLMELLRQKMPEFCKILTGEKAEVQQQPQHKKPNSHPKP